MPFLSVGIAGGTGSGKSTLAHALAARVTGRHLVLDQDSYYRDLSALTLAERKRVNFDHPDALDMHTLAAHLAELRAGRGFAKPKYDFTAHTRLPGTDRIEPAPLVIVEGILVLADAALRAQLDYKVFVDTPESVRFSRRVHRDLRERGRNLEDVRRQLAGTARPMHDLYVQPSSAHADIVLSGVQEWDARWEADLQPLVETLRARGIGI